MKTYDQDEERIGQENEEDLIELSKDTFSDAFFGELTGLPRQLFLN